MNARQLNRDQLTELKQRMVDDEIYEVEGRSASYGELAEAESIPDERVFEEYEGTEFTPGDFLCASGKEEKQVRDESRRDDRVHVHDKKQKEAEL